MGSAFHQLCPRYSGTLTPTAPTAIKLWDTFTFTFTGRLPQVWKSSNITCIYKSGDKESASHYRPMSITSIRCRLLEKLARNAFVSII